MNEKLIEVLQCEKVSFTELQTLIEAGADPNLTNERGDSVFEYVFMEALSESSRAKRAKIAKSIRALLETMVKKGWDTRKFGLLVLREFIFWVDTPAVFALAKSMLENDLGDDRTAYKETLESIALEESFQRCCEGDPVLERRLHELYELVEAYRQKKAKAAFEKRLAACADQTALAELAEAVLDELCETGDACLCKGYITALLDRGLDPHFQTDDGLWIEALAYPYDYEDGQEELAIAKEIFERAGVPSDFYDFIATKVDYNYYNVPYIVKLYLLASAYVWEQRETYIQMSENLYREMFSESGDYTSLKTDCQNLYLTPAIFKDIERFDFSVEMLPQELGKSKWRLHIFEKDTKIEVAQYV